jgi:hypothetical protein
MAIRMVMSLVGDQDCASNFVLAPEIINGLNGPVGARFRKSHSSGSLRRPAAMA